MSPTGSVAASRFALVRRALDLRFRSAVLAQRTWESDSYVRIRVEGRELGGFESHGSDDHVRVFFPDGPMVTQEQMRAAPSREYTPVAWGDDWLDLEFVIHGAPGQRGVAAHWAAHATLGAPVGVGGPRGSLVIEGEPDAWFLAGDETAVPAIRRFAALMPPDARGEILIEGADAAHDLPVAAPAGVAVQALHRDGRAEGVALAEALDARDLADRPEGAIFGFVAAEQSIVKSGRRLLLDRWGVDSSCVTIKGYWKHGESEYHAPH